MYKYYVKLNNIFVEEMTFNILYCLVVNFQVDAGTTKL